MIGMYIVSLIYLAVFLIASYFAIVEGNTLGMWVTGICLWILGAVVFGNAMFG